MIGRRDCFRADARLLIGEHRASEVRVAEHRGGGTEAVEADQQRRASLGPGVPASALPAGMSYAEAIHAG